MLSPKLLRKTKNRGDDYLISGDELAFETFHPINIRLLKYHFIIISAYIIVEVSVARLVHSDDSFKNYFFFYLLDLFFFYFNLIFLLPKFYRKRKRVWKVIIITIVASLIHFSLRILIFAGLYLNYDWISTFKTKGFFAAAIWRSIWILGLSAFYLDRLFIIHKLKQENAIENAMLHARVNPHLLFNVLNFAYADTDPYSKGGKILVLLGEFTRYSMMELPSDGKWLLSNELKQLNCLVKMNELRFPESNLKIDIAPELANREIRIPPQIIISLAENLFKHGDLYSTTYPAFIAVWKDEQTLHVEMENARTIQNNVVSHKIGLQNARQRLENIYKHKFRLEIDNNQAGFFKLDLTMPL